MNNERFNKIMHSIDEELLEQAQYPVSARRHRHVFSILAAAACVCLILLASLASRPTPPVTGDKSDPPLSVVNPVSGVTQEQVQELGYSIPLPENASDCSWSLIDTGSDSSMVQVNFTVDNTVYTCRALKTEETQDISGLYYDWERSLDWVAGELEMQLRAMENEICWLGWYAPDEGTQWCISTENGAAALMLTAQHIVETLGYDLAVAPSDAENVIYSVHEQGNLVIGQTCFSVHGHDYVFRMSATSEVAEDFIDISGIDTLFQVNKDTSIAWCSARMSFDEGGSGKIVWFDVVPGILYSLSMESGASEASLTAMALSLYEPAQAES